MKPAEQSVENKVKLESTSVVQVAGKRDQPDTASEFKEPPAKRLKSSDQETTAQEKPETNQNSQEEDLRWDSS